MPLVGIPLSERRSLSLLLRFLGLGVSHISLFIQKQAHFGKAFKLTDHCKQRTIALCASIYWALDIKYQAVWVKHDLYLYFQGHWQLSQPSLRAKRDNYLEGQLGALGLIPWLGLNFEILYIYWYSLGVWSLRLPNKPLNAYSIQLRYSDRDRPR